MTSFSDLGLSAAICRALDSEGYVIPTLIQAQAIPTVLAGRDLLGIAQTGSGKTAAYALPILQRLADRRMAPIRGTARVLVLSPTRELASQIAESFRTYGKHLSLSIAVVYGGVGKGPQVRAVSNGVDIVIATPGRLLDLMQMRALRLDRSEIFVLDEADRMLDMGFIPAIRRIVQNLPKVRQNLMFSATMPNSVTPLVASILRDPVRVSVTPVATTVSTVTQQVIFTDKAKKRDLLATLLRTEAAGRTLVFTRTKRGADRVARHLAQVGIASEAIHGDKSQSQRERALAGFRSGHTRVLIATDIAARGIDVDGITHVINFEVPNEPESYVHRIGRTARAGASGTAISLCDPEERVFIRQIERLTRQALTVFDPTRGGSPRPPQAKRPLAA